jgi:peroxiredoxin Q/BCP
MPVELRKRKAPVAPPAPAPSKKKAATKARKPAGKAKEEVKKPEAKADKPSKDEEATESAPEAPEEKETVKDTEESAKDDAKEEPKDDKKKPAAAAAAGKIAVGDVIDLEGFGGEIQTNDGDTTSLKKLVDGSKSGVVLFTYPKASTPGCKFSFFFFLFRSALFVRIVPEYATHRPPSGARNAFIRAPIMIEGFFDATRMLTRQFSGTTQVCLFRDSYDPLTADGLAIYGLSADSTKANTTFKEKQKLPYPLLCDPQATLIGAIGLKKQPKGTQRGVFVVNKEGKVLVAEAGGPAATVDRVKALVKELKGEN